MSDFATVKNMGDKLFDLGSGIMSTRYRLLWATVVISIFEAAARGDRISKHESASALLFTGFISKLFHHSEGTSSLTVYTSDWADKESWASALEKHIENLKRYANANSRNCTFTIGDHVLQLNLVLYLQGIVSKIREGALDSK